MKFIFQKKVIRGLVTLIYTLGMINCTPQTSEPEKEIKDVNTTETITASEPSVLSISTGSAKGTTLLIPEGALEDNSEVSLNRLTGDVEDFNNLTDSSGNSIKSGSSPIQVSAKDASGNEISTLTSPMSLSIPYTGTTSLLEVEKSTDNMCVLLSSKSGKYVWRRKDLSINTTENLTTLNTIYLGVFQVFYCGENTLEGFTEANETDAFFDDLNLSLETSTYSYSSHHICTTLTTNTTTQTLIGYTNKVIGSSKTVTLSIDKKNAAKTQDQKYILTLYYQKESHTCNLTSGNEVDTSQIEFDRKISFNIDGKQLSENPQNTLGKDLFPLTTYKLKVGIPETLTSSLSVDDSFDKEFSFCLSSSTADSYSLAIKDSLNTSSNFSNGTKELTVDIPIDSTASTPTLSMSTNNTNCPDDTAITQDNPVLNLYDSKDNVYYLTPSKILLSTYKDKIETDIEENSLCLEIYSGNIINNFMDKIEGNNRNQYIFKTVISSIDDYKLLIPFDTRSSNNDGIPQYDTMISSSSNCSNTNSVESQYISFSDSTLSKEMSLNMVNF